MKFTSLPMEISPDTKRVRIWWINRSSPIEFLHLPSFWFFFFFFFFFIFFFFFFFFFFLIIILTLFSFHLMLKHGYHCVISYTCI